MRKDFEEIDRRFRDRDGVLAVFHAARFSFDGNDSFVSSNTLLEVFLRFGFSVDLLRRVNQDDSVDTFAVVSAPSKRLDELSLLSAITAEAVGTGDYLFVRKGFAYKVSQDGIESRGSCDGISASSFLDAESYGNPFSAILPLSRKLRKGDYQAVSKAVERLVG